MGGHALWPSRVSQGSTCAARLLGAAQKIGSVLHHFVTGPFNVQGLFRPRRIKPRSTRSQASRGFSAQQSYSDTITVPITPSTYGHTSAGRAYLPLRQTPRSRLDKHRCRPHCCCCWNFLRTFSSSSLLLFRSRRCYRFRAIKSAASGVCALLFAFAS